MCRVCGKEPVVYSGGRCEICNMKAELRIHKQRLEEKLREQSEKADLLAVAYNESKKRLEGLNEWRYISYNTFQSYYTSFLERGMVDFNNRRRRFLNDYLNSTYTILREAIIFWEYYFVS